MKGDFDKVFPGLRELLRSPLVKTLATITALMVAAFVLGFLLSGCSAFRTCKPGEPASMWCHQSW